MKKINLKFYNEKPPINRSISKYFFIELIFLQILDTLHYIFYLLKHFIVPLRGQRKSRILTEQGK